MMASGRAASPADPISNTQYSEDEIRAIVAEAQAANTCVMVHAGGKKRALWFDS